MRSLRHWVFIAMLAGGMATPAHAQFNLNSWMHFEDGRLPTGTVFMHQAAAGNTRVVEYATLGKPGITDGVAGSECGRYGIQFTTDAKQRYLCIMAPAVLQRDKLGAEGRALFQVDIHMDGQNDLGHTLAVVALGVDPASPPKAGAAYWKMYRFGALGGNKAFFSFMDGAATPKIYLHENLAGIAPKATKGWHRFQFVIEGNRGISCYVDGIKTSYSPVAENTLTHLQPGLMVGAPETAPMTVLMDNLSIQWTMDPSTPMPNSPWIDEATVDAAESRLLWKSDVAAAMLEARSANKPLAMLFYMPGNLAFQELNNNILQNSDEAREYLEGLVPVRVDVNQLMGADLARRHAIVRVPTIAILNPDGTERGRVVMLPGERWKTLRPKMEKVLGE